ncbi:hypothetical protein LCGC14_2711270, partial [marine sediment metagenome]
MVDTLTIVKNKIEEYDKLYQRMDKTRDRVYNTPYEMIQVGTKKKLDNIVNVTMPYAAIIANTVINDLMGSYSQTIVEGVSATQRRVIEGFINDNRAEADEGLLNTGWHASLFE